MKTKSNDNLVISDDEDTVRDSKELYTTDTVNKVVRILKQVKLHLDYTLSSKELLKNLNWAIFKIETNSLYSNNYDSLPDEENKQYDPEKTEFLEGFQDYNLVNNIYKQNRDRVAYRTSHTIDLKGIKKIREKLIIDKLKNDYDPIDGYKSKNTESFTAEGTKKKLSKSKTIKPANGKTDIYFSTEDLEKVENLRYDELDDEKLINFKISESLDDTQLSQSLNLDKRKIDNSNLSYDMNSIVNRNFNIFYFESIFSREKSFILIGKELFRSLDVIHLIDSKKLESFLVELRNMYIPTNPYHNERHGADVGQTTSSYLKESEIIDLCYFQDLDVLSMIVSSIGHDAGHPGINNNYQVNKPTEHAYTYHDKSVLENYHIYLIFKILRKDETNICSSLKKEEFSLFRKRVIEAILATDMSFHGKVVANLKNRIFNWKEAKKNNPDELFINPKSKTFFDDQQEVINLIIHSADISHNTKPFIMSEKWTEFLTEEFHNQGDKEKLEGLPISFLCDRTTSNVPKSQIGFINFVIIPTFDVVVEAFPSLEYLMINAKKNLNVWESKLKESEINK